ncbi:10744_t:CDS:2, partial [Diversispora eburnea]
TVIQETSILISDNFIANERVDRAEFLRKYWPTALEVSGDIEALFYRSYKEYGHNGIYELTIAEKRQIVITHVEHIESILKHAPRLANDGLLDLFDLYKKRMKYLQKIIESGEFIESINVFVSDNQFIGRNRQKKRKEIEYNNNSDFKSRQLDPLTSLIITNTPYDPQILHYQDQLQIQDIDACFYKLNKEYGRDGLYELNIAGRRQIVITRAEYIETLLRHVTRSANDGLLDLFDLDKKGLGLNHDYNRWKFNRRIFSQAIMSLTSSTYSPKLSKIENGLFEEMSNYWIDLKQKDENVIIIDMAAWTRRFICDFISTLTTEKRTNTIHYYYRKLKNEVITKEMIESEEFIENINVFVSNNQFLFAPKHINNLPFIKNRVKRLLDNNHFFYKRLEEIIRRKRKEIEYNNNSDFKSKQLDLLTSLIITNTPNDPQPQKNVDPSLSRPMTDAEIRGVMFDAFYAATDTTANIFCFILYYISHNPNVKKKLLEEIKSVFNDDPNRQVTIDDLEKLKYCEAIIKETSRIRPTVGMISRYIDMQAPLNVETSTITICKELNIKLIPREFKTHP